MAQVMQQPGHIHERKYIEQYKFEKEPAHQKGWGDFDLKSKFLMLLLLARKEIFQHISRYTGQSGANSNKYPGHSEPRT
jgi:hypothetical protein